MNWKTLGIEEHKRVNVIFEPGAPDHPPTEGRDMSQRRRETGRNMAGTETQWQVVFHDEFFDEYGNWSEVVQDAVLSSLGKLRLFGPSLGRPSVDTLKGSEFPNMKELRVDAEGGVWRILFAFDPRR